MRYVAVDCRACGCMGRLQAVPPGVETVENACGCGAVTTYRLGRLPDEGVTVRLLSGEFADVAVDEPPEGGEG